MTYQRLAIFCIVLCALVNVGRGQIADNVDGGADGVNGHQHLEGTADTEKIIFGMNCIKEDKSSTEVKFEFFVYQKDNGFKFTSTANTFRKGQLVIYDTCHFIDATDYNNDKTIRKATADANCENTVEYSAITTPDATSTSTLYDVRTKKHTLTVPDPSVGSQYKCGSRKDTNDIEVMTYCKRDAGFDKAFDIVFKAKYDTTSCTATSIEYDKLTVAGPPKIDVKYNLEVTMKVYQHPDIGTSITTQESASGNEIKVPVALGTSAYLEFCLKIPPNTAGYNQFFVDGITPIAVRPHTCTAAADIANDDFQTDIEGMTTWPTIVLPDGCGGSGDTDKGLKEFFGKSDYIFKWLKGTETKSHLMSPNCAKSVTFPLVSMARLKANDVVTTIYNCKLDYCFTNTDEKCFGNQAGGSNPYPTCPTTRKRRRRETVEVGEGLPSEVSVRVDIIMPGMKNNGTSSGFDGCFEKTAFIGITSVLSTLLFAVLLAAVFLAVKLGGAVSNESSTDSMTGIQNKGYY